MKPIIVGENAHLISKPDVQDFKKARRQRQNLVDLTKIDRLPPHSIEAEQGVLGCILLGPQESMVFCIEKFKAGAEVFYDLRHQTVYEVLVKMYNDRKAMDMITISQCLRDAHQLDAIGGLAYLSSLEDSTPSPANLSYYVDIVLEKWRCRKLIADATEVVATIYEGAESKAVTAKAFASLTEAFASSVDQASIKTLSRLVVDEITEQHQSGAGSGLTIGIQSIDRIIAGFNTELIVIGARPSMGKTSNLCTLARNIAGQGIPVGFITLESDAQTITKRMVAIESRLNFRRISEFKDSDIEMVLKSSAAVGKLPVKIHHQRAMDINQLCAVATGWSNQGTLKALVIDYLKLIRGSKEWRMEKDRIAEVANRLADLKAQLGIPVFVAHQLNRDAEEKSRPRLSNLSGAVEVEEHADVVILLHQEDSNKGRSRMPVVDAVAIVDKRRHGDTGDADVRFHRYCGLFDDRPLGTETQ